MRKRDLIAENELLKKEIALLKETIVEVLDLAVKHDARRGLETRSER